LATAGIDLAIFGTRRQRRAAGVAKRNAAADLRVVRQNSVVRTAVASRDVMILQLLVAGITIFGLVMVLSASSVVSIVDYGSPWSLFLRQAIWTVLGIAAFAVARRVDLQKMRRFIVPFFVLTAVMLLAVLLPGLGQVSGGSSRWIGAGPVRIQPSEFAKLAFALYGADLLARRVKSKDVGREILRPIILVLGFLGILIVKQPDLGTAIILVCIAITLLYAGGIERRVLGTLIAVAIGLAGILAIAAPYRRDRLLSFLHPFSQASTSGYQLAQALASMGSGHIVGAGLGATVSKWFLPNAQTDFIFAVVGNEFGLIGSIAVVACFVAIGVLGLRIAARATDPFSRLLATAITAWIVLQAFINIGGVIGIMPETGIPLPFLSFGGSSLVVALFAMGIVINIAEPKSKLRGARSGHKRLSAPRR
jgi:cell division protein FtsW